MLCAVHLRRGSPICFHGDYCWKNANNSWYQTRSCCFSYSGCFGNFINIMTPSSWTDSDCCRPLASVTMNSNALAQTVSLSFLSVFCLSCLHTLRSSSLGEERCKGVTAENWLRTTKKYRLPVPATASFLGLQTETIVLSVILTVLKNSFSFSLRLWSFWEVSSKGCNLKRCTAKRRRRRYSY